MPELDCWCELLGCPNSTAPSKETECTTGLLSALLLGAFTFSLDFGMYGAEVASRFIKYAECLFCKMTLHWNYNPILPFLIKKYYNLKQIIYCITIISKYFHIFCRFILKH
jgi:hypothetical protein